MRCSCRLLTSFLLATPFLCAAVSQAADPERPQRETAGQSKTSDQWKQVAAIESCDRSEYAGDYSQVPNHRYHSAIAFLDRGRFAIADWQHPIRVVAVDDGKVLRSFGSREKDSAYQRYMVSSSDGHLLVLLPDAQPQIWDTRTGECIGTLPAVADRYEDRYIAAAFLPDGLTLATYRDERTRGNLQIWALNEHQRKVTLRKNIDADRQGRELACVGPYLLLKTAGHYLVFDAFSMECLYRQPPKAKEGFLFLDPPLKNEPGRFVSVDCRAVWHGWRDWTGELPPVVSVPLPDGRETHRWDRAVPENTDPPDRFMYQSPFAISPNRRVIAISTYGRLHFFRFPQGTKVSSIQANDPTCIPRVTFLDEKRILVPRWGPWKQEKIIEMEITSGRELSAIPEIDSRPLISSDGRALIARRYKDSSAPTSKSRPSVVSRGSVVLWERTEGQPR